MSSLGGVSSNGLNFSGLATGIDTTKIIDGLTKISQKRIDTLTAKQTKISDSQATFAGLQATLFDLQSKTNGLARSIAGTFDGRTASTSDATAVTAAAGTSATAGTYSLTVVSLAQAHQTASAGYSDPNAQIKQGTLTIQVGTGTTTTVTVDSRNSTLQGLADSINSAGGDVRASVINDGSASPYRLLLSATKTGATNAITVTNNLTNGTGADINPAATTVQAASDARVTLGSGTGAVTVSGATNQVTGLIPGVTLNLVRADPTKAVTLNVANDTAAATKGVQDFVTAYNSVVDYVGDRSKYDAATNSAGKLLGDRTAAGLTNDIAAALQASIPGLNPNANRLSSVGLSFDDKGHLKLDAAKLGSALSGQNGTTPADVKRLFGVTGTSDSPGVSFTLATGKTKASGSTPYGVNVTAPATRAVVTASGPPAASVTIAPPNNALQIKINGLLSSGLTLDSGTYTPDALAALLQQKINTNSALNGNQVSVGLDTGGRIQITSQTYGSSSLVSFEGGTALADLGFAGTETGAGTNVAGNFVANGVTEAATGSGQTLTGKAGNANTDGLQVKATGSAPGTANVSVTQGLAGRLNEVLGKYLDPLNGRIATVTKTLQSSFDGIDKTITKQNDALAEQKSRLTVQFAAMETAVNNLKGLQTQLASFAVIRTN